VTAFDTGPGNMVIDALAKTFSKGKLSCDRGGRIAASGTINRPLLDRVLADAYYRQQPPKSAGREQYGAAFVGRLTDSGLPLQDLIATATAITAATIGMAVEQTAGAADLIVSGGGVHNPRIMAHLAGYLPRVPISTSTDHGIDADAKEAVAFAVLAYRTWRKEPSNLPSATGAAHPVILGSITP
jgi:anhydro-N-acetylmuramic acid kinase